MLLCILLYFIIRLQNDKNLPCLNILYCTSISEAEYCITKNIQMLRGNNILVLQGLRCSNIATIIVICWYSFQRYCFVTENKIHIMIIF